MIINLLKLNPVFTYITNTNSITATFTPVDTIGVAWAGVDTVDLFSGTLSLTTGVPIFAKGSTCINEKIGC